VILIEVKQFLIGASAGPGAIAGEEIASEAIGFAPQWLRRMGADPGALSLITVSGDSMEPTLANGDDIMIDARASQRPLRDGIHVLRADDVLLVKRIASSTWWQAEHSQR
ncbi:MAG: S24 family peptidase, partial [Parasphingorhabdus sp.]|nr:S24 family peptidase [Parasphingorhabdus sp.]